MISGSIFLFSSGRFLLSPREIEILINVTARIGDNALCENRNEEVPVPV